MAVLSILLPALLAVPFPAATQAPAPPPPVWERVVVLGASAAAGFGTGWETGGADVPLGRFLAPMLPPDHDEVLDLGDPLFFLDPRGKGRRQVLRAAAARPTLVVAVDFLFWFTYGLPPEDRAGDVPAWRRELLEEGLALLDRLPGPVLTAEVPDMRAAIGTMLRAEQVPAPEELAVLNRRIREWAGERPRVHLVPLAAELDRLRREGAARRDGAEPPLLQWDHLHPTLAGLARLAALSLTTLQDARPWLAQAPFHLDEAAALAAVRRSLGLGAVPSGS